VNARDAMPSGGRLRIEAVPLSSVERGDQVRISVEDTGVGIPPEMIERILEPFFTTKAGGEGTGLGLAVVQRVVTSAGGSVEVSSDVGRGTRVTLLLPAHRIEGHAARDAAPHASGTLLLVEPHEVLRPMLGEMLRSIGHTVLQCESTTEAIRLAREHARGPKELRVSVLVAEHGTPGALGSMSGQRLHAQLEIDLNMRLPVVFMCSDPSLSAVHGGRSDVRLLQKPFEITDLVQAVSAVISAR